MSFLRIRKTIKTPVNNLVYDLIRGEPVDIGGQSIRLGSAKLPVPEVMVDHIRWTFPEPIRVSTPGPDSRVTEIRQYRDKIEFSVAPWVDVVIEVVE